jgi:hypothetical protein
MDNILLCAKEIPLYFDIAALAFSIVSICMAAFALKISIRRYELQQEQFDIQKKEFEDKFKVRLEIKDEHLLTSHQLEPEKGTYFRDNPEDFEFEYHAKFVNRSNVIVKIEILTIGADAVDVEEMWMGCGDIILQNAFIAPNEELDVIHRFKKGNLNGFRRAISRFSEKIGTLEITVNCKFSGVEHDESIEHKRVLYRMTENCGDISTRGYEPGKGKEKRSFLY